MNVTRPTATVHIIATTLTDRLCAFVVKVTSYPKTACHVNVNHVLFIICVFFVQQYDKNIILVKYTR